MAFIGILSFLSVIILQPAEWIKAFEGVPVQELLTLYILITVFITKPNRISEIFKLNTTKYLVYFIIVSILSAMPIGMEYALGTIGYNYFKFFTAYLVVVSVIDSEKKLKQTLFFMVMCGVVVSYYCIRLYYTGEGIGEGIGTQAQQLNWRGSVQWIGTFSGTNTTGLLLVVLLSFAIGHLYKTKGALTKLFGLFTTVVIGWAFFLTHSRGGFIGLLLILASYFYTYTNLKLKTYIPLAIMLGVLLIVLKPEEEGRGIGESSTPERIELFHQGIQMFKENPITGVGSGQFAKNNPVKKVAHNIYLQHLAETGFIGAFLFTLIFYSIFKHMIAVNRNSTVTIEEKRITNVITCTTIGFLGATFFLSAQHEIPYIIIGLAVVVPFLKGEIKEITKGEKRFIFMVNIIFIMVIYLLIQLFFVLF